MICCCRLLSVLFVHRDMRLFPSVQARWDVMRLARNASIRICINFLLGHSIVLRACLHGPQSHGLGLRPNWWNMAALICCCWIACPIYRTGHAV